MEELDLHTHLSRRHGNILDSFARKDEYRDRRRVLEKAIELLDALEGFDISEVLEVCRRRKAEEALHKRAKELSCLYGIAELVEKYGTDLDKILDGVISLIPPAWQYPVITCCGITVNGQTFKTANFMETDWKLSSNIKAYGKNVGVVEVYYLEEMPERHEGPFLEEERSLMDAIAERLGRIIEHKKMNEELEKYTEHLEELIEERTRELKRAERMAAIGETAAMIGLDLRNPLQAIASTLYLARKKLSFISSTVGEKEDLKEMCGTIEGQIRYIDKILSDLQDYTTPIKAECVETSMRQLLDEILSSIIVPENVRVSVSVDEKLSRLMIDPALMRRAFTNLVMNALQAMPKGGQLKIIASKTIETASISFKDTGVGIPEENFSKLFNPLFTTKAKEQGLGLPVCKRLVEAHDGSITVESKVGKGSTFTVKIPLNKKKMESG